MLHIEHSSLKIQSYLLPENVWNIQLAKFLFQARTRMLEVKCNYKEKYTREGLQCELGCSEQDNQEHLLTCEQIIETSVSEERVPEYKEQYCFKDCKAKEDNYERG